MAGLVPLDPDDAALPPAPLTKRRDCQQTGKGKTVTQWIRSTLNAAIQQ